MLEDELLKLRFRCGSASALAAIYRKYAERLLNLAIALLGDLSAGEDVVHDVFVKFAASNGSFRLQGSLRSYLATCVVNRARDVRRRDAVASRASVSPADRATPAEPYRQLVDHEASLQVAQALTELPYEQREAVLLHAMTDMTFREIAAIQDVSLRTAQGRYRYGLEKVQAMLTLGDEP